MSTTPVPSEQLPRPRRRVVYRAGAYSTVHRFRHATAHLEAFRTGRRWHVDQLMPRTAPVRREAVVRCATTLADAVAQAVARIDLRAVQAPDHTDDNLRAYAAAGWDVVDSSTGRAMAWARRHVGDPYPWQPAEHEGLVPVNSSRSAGAALDVRETPRSTAPGPLGPVIVVPCSGIKAPTRTALPARDLYRGSYHLLCRQAAERLAGDTGDVVVLSAQHGFVTLDEPLFPYDLRMGRPGSVTAELLAVQAAQLGILPGPRPVVALGGRAYVQAVTQLRPDTLQPLAGCRGIGEQRARLARLARDERPLDVLHQLTAAAAPTA
ncbi:DUF6884 domain-containing protein [Streptomyces virginiae]|uniref:DUF6884 domain-containing protein n=1 Tax=Streptomyces virginiae TaxID=1961 RepID=UPI002F91399C|nr:hypothetical protein OG253_40905 [Streptomyces virginiae]